MLRAIRLVVDTGFHYKHWTRQQVVDYFHEHSNTDEPTVQSETDRYIAWPGQALAYKVGQLTILEAARGSEAAARRQIRHPRVPRRWCSALGALPLDVFEQQVRNWIRTKRGSAA